MLQKAGKRESGVEWNVITISLCMIVKNEESVLGRCLASVKGLADEIIIVDTGSTDKTKEIALSFHANIYDFQWKQNFAAARNYAFSKATMDFILWLDADDVLLNKERKKFLQFKKQLSASVDSVTMPYHLQLDNYGNVLSSLRRNRLVNRKRNFQWYGAVHEYLEVGGNIVTSEIAVTHLPLTRDVSRNLKIYEDRLAKGEVFQPRDLYYFANELKDHQQYERAVTYYETFLSTKKGWIEDNIAACGKLADCYTILGNKEKSIQSILKTFTYAKPRAEYCCKLANYYFETAEYETAVYWYEKALQSKVPKDNFGIQNSLHSTWIPHIQLCVCYDKLGDYQKAYNHNEIAGTYRPNDPKYLHNKKYLENMTHTLSKRVLVASPVRQTPEILDCFLQSLKRLKQEGLLLDFYLIDDNIQLESTNLLKEFKSSGSVKIETIQREKDHIYVKNHTTHYWTDELVWKVAALKDRLLQYAKEHHYDYLFLVDSDLILHPDTLIHLIKQKKDIISEIFWTRWQPEAMEQPQVWLSDEYTQYRKCTDETLNEEQVSLRYTQFLNQLKTPGVYEVGGLGACTLLSRAALNAGVNFSKIKNLTFWGEDRHFCVRASALGLSLWVDTHLPAYHIYRNSDLPQARRLLKNRKPHITLSMIIKNETDRFLRKALMQHKDYIDAAVIIDDGSEDGSAEICREILNEIPLTIITNIQSKFENEIDLRKQQWDETIKTDPDWILNLDADEILEDVFGEQLLQLVNQHDIDLYSFRIFDFWDDTHYREDQHWGAHLMYRPFLLRYKKNFSYTWTDKKQHCGRFPSNIFQLPNAISPLRIKHYGWARPELRKEKFDRYLYLDPEGEFGNKEQYKSILDKNPRLVRWIE